MLITMTQTSTLNAKREDLAFESLNRDMISKILGTVVYDKAFFFYEEIGKPTGDFAINLSDFCNKINTVAPKCLAFHLKRGDFENWVREIIGDIELSQQIGKLKASKTVWKNDATLRNKLHATIRDRVAELQELWHHTLTWPESAVA
jgi:hypothetical protein